MCFRFILIFLTICSLTVSSEEKKIPACDQRVYDHDFSINFNNFVWRMWRAFILNSPRGENIVLYPYNLLRLFLILYGGALNPTREEFENITKWKYTNFVNSTNRYVTCLKKQNFHKAFKVQEKGYFGLFMTPAINPKFKMLAQSTFGIQFHKGKPYLSPQYVLKKLKKDEKKITKKQIKHFFTLLMGKDIVTGMLEGFIYGGHNFDFKWNSSFNQKNTEKGKFLLDPGKKETVETKIMKIRGEFPRSEEHYEEMADWVEVPFKETRFSMIVIVPRKNYNLWEVTTKMRYEHFFHIMLEKEKKNNVTLRLPKFKIKNESIYDFTPVMKHDEIKLAALVDKFNAKLGCMGFAPIVYVSSIKQKTFLDINEKQIKSAAIINSLIKPMGFKNPSSRQADKPEYSKLPKDLKMAPECSDFVFPKPGVSVPGKPGFIKRSLSKPDDKVDNVKLKREDSPISEMHQSEKKPAQRAREFEINATRPFMIAIIDRQARIPLLFARISNPKGKKKQNGTEETSNEKESEETSTEKESEETSKEKESEETSKEKESKETTEKNKTESRPVLNLS